MVAPSSRHDPACSHARARERRQGLDGEESPECSRGHGVWTRRRGFEPRLSGSAL